MPYILTYSGWKSLSENDKTNQGEKDDEGKYPPRLTDQRIKEIEALWKEIKSRNSEKLRDRLKERGEEPTNEANTNLNESQMELLESLYEDGYLSEEQLNEISKETAQRAYRARMP